MWSVPQSRERILKAPVSELTFCASTSKKRQYHDLDESGDNDWLIDIQEKQQKVMPILLTHLMKNLPANKKA